MNGFDRLNYLMHHEPGQLIGVIFIFVAIAYVLGFCYHQLFSSGSSYTAPPKSIEDLAQEAAWLRAKGNLAEAEQDYKLKQAALQQTEIFIKQNLRK